jgi:hypothetical protein
LGTTQVNGGIRPRARGGFRCRHLQCRACGHPGNPVTCRLGLAPVSPTGSSPTANPRKKRAPSIFPAGFLGFLLTFHK